MALSRDGVIFSYGRLDKYGLQYSLLTMTQHGITDETMETRLMAIFKFKDCGNGCVNSTVTIATANKKLDVTDDEVLLSWQHISNKRVTCE